MRTGKCTAAAVLLWAGYSGPCAAQLHDYPDPEPIGPVIVAMERGRSDLVGPDGRLFPQSGPGLGITSTPYARSDGSPAIRNGIVGSLPVARNMDLGVGIFSVTRYKGEPEFRRVQPMRDAGERPNNRLAAVGLKVRF